jgi:hypothetical protein
MVYEPAPELRSRRAAESALYEALLEAHRIVLADEPGSFDLLLSGGKDSRGVLACLSEIGRPPTRAFSWGMRPDIPHSDPLVAAGLAETYRVPFEFKSYVTERFIENAGPWAYISELANDNIGWHAEGQSVLVADYETDGAFMLTGDECFGGGSWARNEEEVRSEVVPARLPAEFRNLLNDKVDEYDATYRRQVDSVLRWCENDHLIDRRNYYYVYGRVARFIMPFGHYKEIAVEIRRPFLARNVVEVIRQLPHKYRAYKNLYLSMLSRYFPLAASAPARAVDSLPDWEYDVMAEPRFRSMFLELLSTPAIESSVLSRALDIPRFEAFRDGYFGRPLDAVDRIPREPRRGMSRFLPSRLRRESVLFDRFRHMTRNTTRLTTLRSRSEWDVLRCLALIRLLEEKTPDIAGR